MFSSVRVRLTLWYTAALACALLALAFATYFVLRRNSAHQTDAAMVEMAESFLTTVRAETRDVPGSDSLKEGAEKAILEHNFRDTVFVVLDAESRVVVCSDNKHLPAAVSTVVEHTLSAHEAHPFRTIRLRDQAYRSFVRDFVIGGAEYTLLVLQSLHRQDEFLKSVLSAFALAIPLSLVLASGGGYFLARRSLSPVAEMSTQAGRIGADNLHERLQVTNAQDELGLLAQSFLMACSTGWISRLNNSGDSWPMHLTNCVLQWPSFAERRMLPCHSQVARQKTTARLSTFFERKRNGLNIS